MFEFTSRTSQLKFILFLFTILLSFQSRADFEPDREAVITKLLDENKIIAESNREDWNVGEILAVVSQNAKLGTIAFIEVLGVSPLEDGKFELRLSLQRQSRKYFIQSGDFVRRLDLSTKNPDYLGTTDLLIHKSQMNISSKYRPLVYQGFVIGDTAQTLFEKEFLINYFGNIYYGYNDWLTLGTLAPVNVLGRPNANFRAKIYDSETTTISTGLSFVRLIKEKQTSFNLNFYWDSTSSEALISHTFIGLGLATIDNAGDSAAIKYLTSNTFQTGYEAILDNWDRFLIGPSYNFDKKALGGYLSYVWIVDRLHVQVSVNATDITHLRLDPTDGYYGFFDMFWRF
jgi:hypothetical protein